MDVTVKRSGDILHLSLGDTLMWKVYPDGSFSRMAPDGSDKPTNFGIELYHYLALEDSLAWVQTREVKLHSDYELYFQAYDRARIVFAGSFGWAVIRQQYRQSARRFVLAKLAPYRRQCRSIATMLTAPSFVMRGA